jgi:hypothetical protein
MVKEKLLLPVVRLLNKILGFMIRKLKKKVR